MGFSEHDHFKILYRSKPYTLLANLRQMKENSKLINGGFNKWMEILAGKDLPTKLGKSKNVAMKYSESNGTVN